MAAYGDIELTLAGAIAEGIEGKRSIKSRVVQDSNGINFGAAAMGYIGDEVECYPIILDVSKIVFDSDFEVGDSVSFTVNSLSTAAIPFNTDHATTMNDIVSALQGLSGIDVYEADATEDPNNRTIYVRSKGVTNVASMTDEAGTPPAETITNETDQVFLGIAAYSAKNISVANSAKYEQYEDVNILEYGNIYALSDGSISALQDLYMHIAAGAALGKQTATAGVSVNTKAKSDNKSVANISTDAITKIEVRGSYKPYAAKVWS